MNRKQQGGFTLIEMAIVLVIIGLIIGAILKGQDLIENSRAKRFANFIRQAEVAQWTFYDRNGFFAGDNTGPGTIPPEIDGQIVTGGEPAANAYEDLERYGGVDNFVRKVTIGSTVFWVGFGMAEGCDDVMHPAIIVVKEPSTEFTEQEAGIYCKSFDMTIDGLEGAGDGKVMSHINKAGTSWYGDDDETGIFTSITSLVFAEDRSWNVNDETIYSLVYFFDAGRGCVPDEEEG